MRTRERLIEVLESVNPEVLGDVSQIFRYLASDLRDDRLPMYAVVGCISDWMLCHHSPHVRHLCRDAMFWIECRASDPYR